MKIRVAHANGNRIVGTWDTIPGTAHGLIYKLEGDTVEVRVDYDGETDVDWNGQEQMVHDGEPLYVCEAGVIHQECDLEWVEEEEEAE